MLAHVVRAGVDPEGVVHDAVHDRVGMHSEAGALVPVLLSVLRAKDGGAGVVAPLQQFVLGTCFGKQCSDDRVARV